MDDAVKAAALPFDVGPARNPLCFVPLPPQSLNLIPSDLPNASTGKMPKSARRRLAQDVTAVSSR